MTSRVADHVDQREDLRRRLLDVYRVVATRNTEVIVRFTHAMGDIDIEAVREDGTRIAQSLSVANEERVRATGTFYVRVFIVSGTNPYTIETRPL